MGKLGAVAPPVGAGGGRAKSFGGQDLRVSGYLLTPPNIIVVSCRVAVGGSLMSIPESGLFFVFGMQVSEIVHEFYQNIDDECPYHTESEWRGMMYVQCDNSDGFRIFYFDVYDFLNFKACGDFPGEYELDIAFRQGVFDDDDERIGLMTFYWQVLAIRPAGTGPGSRLITNSLAQPY